VAKRRRPVEELVSAVPQPLEERLRATFDGRRVLVTGHSGFVGSWLSTVLDWLGADLLGIALEPIQGGFARETDLESRVATRHLDIRDRDALGHEVRQFDPEVVFHLAAQPIVSLSYQDPIGTFENNVNGTANLLEALRATSARTIVVVTSDKCYAHLDRPHVEDDPLGGEDPYSASKAAAEIVVASYRKSFFAPDGIGIATARAGNIIGGGDRSPDRIVPDFIRAAERHEALRIRSPRSIRPWQHVLEAVFGYLRLALSLDDAPKEFSGAWNFGPASGADASVLDVVDALRESWERQSGEVLVGPEVEPSPMPERAVLRLDSTKAVSRLGWRPLLGLETAMDWTVEWHLVERQHDPEAIVATAVAQLGRYLELARRSDR
jgi:CDP-glucose 4,6-dehydratase